MKPAFNRDYKHHVIRVLLKCDAAGVCLQLAMTKARLDKHQPQSSFHDSFRISHWLLATSRHINMSLKESDKSTLQALRGVAKAPSL